MRNEDLGFHGLTGRHSKVLTHAETTFVGILWDGHVDGDNKISADDLAMTLALELSSATVGPAGRWPCKRGEWGVQDEIDYEFRIYADPPDLESWKREVRRMHNHLLRDHRNIPILSKAGPGGGYWIAESEDEARAFYETFRRRGLTGLVKAARGNQAALVDMVQQASFEFDQLEDHTEQTSRIRPRAFRPTDVEIVDAMLERMTGDPERFADGLRKIGEKYDSVLLPKERVAAIRAKAAELKDMMEGL